MSEKLSLKEKNIYGASWIVHMFASQSIMALIFPIFTIEFGISAAAVGLMIGLSRVWDAVTDPLMGNISDNFTSRFGKRRPFIFFGSIAMGIIFPIIFHVPVGFSEVATTAWLAISLLLFFTAYTAFIVPLLALGFEMTEDIKERTSVQAYRAAWVAVASLVPPWLYRLVQDGHFDSPIDGSRAVSIYVGLMMAVVGAVSMVFIKEKAARPHTGDKNKMPFFRAFLETVRNKQFLILIGFTVAFMIGTTIVVAFGTYLNIYYVFVGDKVAATTMLGLFGTVQAVAGFCSIPAVAWLARRFGKVKIIAVTLTAMLLGTILQWIGFNPQWPILQLIVVAPFMGFAGSGFWVLVSSMKADICDYDELLTGHHRAGMYGAVSGWFQKLAIFGATSLAGILITMTLINPDFGGNQTPDAIFRLRLFAMIPGTCFSVISLALVRFYSLTEERMIEIQGILQARRNQEVG